MDACELTSAAASFKIVWGKSVVFSGRRFSRWRLFLDNLTYCCPFVPIRLSRGSWSRWRRSRGSWRSEAWLWRKRCEGKQVEISHSYICCTVFFFFCLFLCGKMYKKYHHRFIFGEFNNTYDSLINILEVIYCTHCSVRLYGCCSPAPPHPGKNTLHL